MQRSSGSQCTSSVSGRRGAELSAQRVGQLPGKREVFLLVETAPRADDDPGLGDVLRHLLLWLLLDDAYRRRRRGGKLPGLALPALQGLGGLEAPGRNGDDDGPGGRCQFLNCGAAVGQAFHHDGTRAPVEGKRRAAAAKPAVEPCGQARGHFLPSRRRNEQDHVGQACLCLLLDDRQEGPEGLICRHRRQQEDLVGPAGDELIRRACLLPDDGCQRRPHVRGQGPAGPQKLEGLIPRFRYDPDTCHFFLLTAARRACAANRQNVQYRRHRPRVSPPFAPCSMPSWPRFSAPLRSFPQALPS